MKIVLQVVQCVEEAPMITGIKVLAGIEVEVVEEVTGAEEALKVRIYICTNVAR
jgi:hypothetical protein